jgi:hypothetical protein
MQVLICPGCQRLRDWTAELDACLNCGSVALVRRLGRTVCRDCESSPAAAGSAASATGGDPTVTTAGPVGDDLAAEVAAAIDRVLGRVPVVTSPRCPEEAVAQGGRRSSAM